MQIPVRLPLIEIPCGAGRTDARVTRRRCEVARAIRKLVVLRTRYAHAAHADLKTKGALTYFATTLECQEESDPDFCMQKRGTVLPHRDLRKAYRNWAGILGTVSVDKCCAVPRLLRTSRSRMRRHWQAIHG